MFCQVTDSRQLLLARSTSPASTAPLVVPSYLKPDNFQSLKSRDVSNVSVHTDSVEGFLTKTDVQITRFVLLDHMDWLSDHFFPLLESEWQAILKRAAPQTRILWRKQVVCE